MDIKNGVEVITIVGGTKIVLSFLVEREDFDGFPHGSTKLIFDQIIPQLDRSQKEGEVVVCKGKYYFPKDMYLYRLWEEKIAWRVF